MDTSAFSRSALPSVTDVYTDLSGLQNLKAEQDDEVALKKVAQQFESMFINMLLKNMRAANAVFSEGNMFDSNESKFYRDMHDNQLALSLAHDGGFGIADSMYRQLSRTANNGPDRQIEKDPVPSVANNEIPAIEELPSAPIDSKDALQKQSKQRHSSIAADPEDFIAKVLPAAEQAAKVLGLDKAILIAQSALETGWGSKVLNNANGEPSFNLFNIKADGRWQGESLATDTLEFLGGQFRSVSSKFRSYSSIADSFNDFAHFIKSGERYREALEKVEDGEQFVKKLHQAGYATDPNYSNKILDVYQRVSKVVGEQ